MISPRPLISKSSSPCINPLVTVPRALITLGIIVTFLFHSFVNSLARSRYLSFFSLSFNFTQWAARPVKSTIPQSASSLFFFFFFFLVDKIRLCLQIPEEFVRLILHERIWVVHIPFVHMVKLQFLTLFPLDHFAHPNRV